MHSTSEGFFSLKLDIKTKKSRRKAGTEPLSLEIAQNISHFLPTTIDVVHPGIGASISVSFIANGPALFLSSLSSSDTPTCITVLSDIQRLLTPAHRSSLATYFKDPQVPDTLLKLTSTAVFKRKEIRSSQINTLLENIWTHLFETPNLILLERVHPDLPSQLLQVLAPSKKKYLKGEMALKSRLLGSLSQVSAIRSGTGILPVMCTVLIESLDQLIALNKEDPHIKEKSTFVAVIMRVIVAFDPRVRPWLYEHGKVIEMVTKILQSSDSLEPMVVSQSLEVVKFFGSEYADRLAALNYPSIAHHVASTSPTLFLQDGCRNLLSQMWPKSEQSVNIWKELLDEYKLITDEMYRTKITTNIINTVEYKLKSESEKLDAALTLLEPHELTFELNNISLFQSICALMKPSYADILTPKYFNTVVYCMSAPKCPIEVVRRLIGTWQGTRPSCDLRSRTQRPTQVAPCYSDGFTSKKMPDNRHLLDPQALALMEKEESLLLESNFFGDASLFTKVDAQWLQKITVMLWNQPPLYRAILLKSPVFFHKLIDIIPKQAHAAASLIMLQAILVEAHTDEDFKIDPKTSLAETSTEADRASLASINLRFYAMVSSLVRLPEICSGTGLRNLLRTNVAAHAIDLPIAMMTHRVFEHAIALFKKLESLVEPGSFEKEMTSNFESTGTKLDALVFLEKDMESVTSSEKITELETWISGDKPAAMDSARHRIIIRAALSDFMDLALYFMRLSISLGLEKHYKISVLLAFGSRINHTFFKPAFAPYWSRLVNYKWSLPQQDLTLYVNPASSAPVVFVKNGLRRFELGIVLRNLLTFWLYVLKNTALGSVSPVLARYVDAAKSLISLFGDKLGLACRSLFFDLAAEYSRRSDPLPLTLAEIFFGMFGKYQDAQRMLAKGLTGPGSFDDPDTGIMDPSDGGLDFEQPHFIFTIVKESLLHIAAPPHSLETLKTKAKVLRAAIDSLPKLRFYLLVHSTPNNLCHPTWADEYRALAQALGGWTHQQIETNWTAIQPLLDAYYIPHMLNASEHLSKLMDPLFRLLPTATLGTTILVPSSRVADNGKVSLATLRTIMELILDLLIVLPSDGRLRGSADDYWLGTMLSAPDEALVNRAAWLSLRYTLPLINELELDRDRTKHRFGNEAYFFDHHFKNSLPNLYLHPTAFTACLKQAALRIHADTYCRPPSTVPISPVSFTLIGQLTHSFWFYSRHLIDLAYCDDDDATADWFDTELTACREAAEEGARFTPDGWSKPSQPRPIMHVYERSKINSEGKPGAMRRDWIANQRPNLFPTDTLIDHLAWYAGETQLRYISTKTPKIPYQSGGQVDKLGHGLFISEHKIHHQLPEERKTLHRRDLKLLEIMDLAGAGALEIIPLQKDCEAALATTRRALAEAGLESLECTVAYENHMLSWIHTSYESGEDTDRLNLAIKLAAEVEKDKKQLAMEAERAAVLNNAKEAKEKREAHSKGLVSFSLPAIAPLDSETESSADDSEHSDDDDELTGSFSSSDYSTESYSGRSSLVGSDVTPRITVKVADTAKPESPSAVPLVPDTADNAAIDLVHLKLMKETTFQQLFGALEVLLDSAHRLLDINLSKITYSTFAKSMDPSIASYEFSRPTLPIDSWLAIVPLLVDANHYRMDTFGLYDPTSYALQEFIPTTFYWKWLNLMATISRRLPRVYIIFCRHLTVRLMQHDIAERTNIHEKIPADVFSVVAEFGSHSCNPRINALAPHLFATATETSTSASPSISAATEGSNASSSSAPSSADSGPSSASLKSVVDPSITYASSNENARELTSTLRRAGKRVPKSEHKPSSLFFFDDLALVPSYVIYYLPLLLDAIDKARLQSSAGLHAHLLRLAPKFVTPHCSSQLFELAQFALDQHNMDLPLLRDPLDATLINAVIGVYGRLIAAVLCQNDDLKRFVQLAPLVDRPLEQIKHTSTDGRLGRVQTPITVEHIGGADFICPPDLPVGFTVDVQWTFAALLRVASESFLNSFFSLGAARFKALWHLFSIPDATYGRGNTGSLISTYFNKTSFRAFMMMINIIPDLMTLHDLHNPTFAEMRERQIAELGATPEFAHCNLPPAKPFYHEIPEAMTAWDHLPQVLTSTFIGHPSASAASSVWLMSRHWGGDSIDPRDKSEIYPPTRPQMWPLTHAVGLNDSTVFGYPRLHSLDRKLRLGTTAVQERMESDLYAEIWYPKGARVFNADAALPAAVHQLRTSEKIQATPILKKLPKKEKSTVTRATNLTNRLPDIALNANGEEDDADLRAAIQASLDPMYNPDAAPSASAAPLPIDTRSHVPLIPTITLRSISLISGLYTAEYFTIALGFYLSQTAERFQTEKEFLLSCDSYDFVVWCLRELNIHCTAPGESTFTTLLIHARNSLQLLEITPPAGCTATGPVWRIRDPMSWNFGHNQILLRQTNGSLVDAEKTHVVVIDRVNTVFFENDSVTMASMPSTGSTSSAPAKRPKESEKELRKKKSPKKTVNADVSSPKARRTQKEDEEETAPEALKDNDKTPSNDSKSLSAQRPSPSLNFWIGRIFHTLTHNAVRLEAHVRMGYATKEALEQLKSQPLLAVGDIAGSWAVDSMTGIVYSEGFIQPIDLSTGNELLQRPSDQDQLYGLSFDEYSNEFTVRGLVGSPFPGMINTGQEVVINVPLPFAAPNTEPRILYPCVSFFNDRAFAFFRNTEKMPSL